MNHDACDKRLAELEAVVVRAEETIGALLARANEAEADLATARAVIDRTRRRVLQAVQEQEQTAFVDSHDTLMSVVALLASVASAPTAPEDP